MYRFIAFCALMAGLAGSVSAGLIFHATPGAFNTAVAGLNFLGTEDFESSTLAPNNILSFDDSLQPGVSSSPVNIFPTGTNPAIGMTVQSNAQGGMPNVPSPQGVNGLSSASAGYFSTPDDQLSANFEEHSLDLIFNSPVPEPILAVGLVPLFFDSITFDTAALGNITVRVFDTANALLGSTTVSGVDYVNELAFVGIEATGGDDIGRINLWDGSQDHWQGVDDIEVYAAQPAVSVPEPGVLMLMAVGIAAIGARRRS